MSEHMDTDNNHEEIQSNTNVERENKGVNRIEKIQNISFTYIIIGLNLIMFVITTAAGGLNNPSILSRYGAKINSLIIEGQYYRLITHAFLHSGLAHIAFNMYGLFSLGGIVESIYGKYKFLFIYLLSALTGGIISFTFSTYPSVGASGAIFGLFGALLYLGQKNPKIFSTSFGINIIAVLIFNLVFGFSNTDIDNYAHIGGLIGGYLGANTLGLIYDRGFNKKKVISAFITIIFIISSLSWGIYKNTTSWEYFYEMAVNSYELGNLDKCEQYGKQAVLKNPNAAEVHALLSLTYYNQDREQEGKDAYSKAVSLDKDQSNLYFNLGNLFYGKKRYGEAEEMFKKYVEINPKTYEGYLNLFVVLNAEEKYQEAEINLIKAAEISPNEFLPNVNLGYLYLQKGNYENSKKYLAKAFQIDPKDADVKKALEFLKSKGY